MRIARDVREAIQADENTAAALAATFTKMLSYVALKPGVQAVLLYRLARWCLNHRLRLPAYIFALLDFYMTGADLPPTADLGPGLVVMHPSGVVVSGGVRAGERLRLHHGSVLGFQTAGSIGKGVPIIGDDVLVGVGAKVLGPVRIGDHARIGANAVVLHDVPAGCSAVGVPAKALMPGDDAS